MRLHPWKKILTTLSTLLYLFTAMGCQGSAAEPLDPDIQFVQNMGVGWNLGNSLDCVGVDGAYWKPLEYEIYWHNPPTTKAMIQAIKARGFKTIRIPVTWYQHMHTPGKIDAAWLNRVQQVVDYAIDSGIYVIIDLHHENWTIPAESNRASGEQVMTCIWSQLAVRFQKYDSHLLFECMNEPRLIGSQLEWSTGNAESWNILNQWNQTFVNTIRSTGGNNATRYLLLPTYCNTTGSDALNAFQMPQGEHLILTVHSYQPITFTSSLYGNTQWDASVPSDTKEIDTAMNLLYEKFIANGVPVILGEFGAMDKNNESARAKWASYIIQSAKARNIMCIWWDDGNAQTASDQYMLFDRYRYTWKYPQIVSALLG